MEESTKYTCKPFPDLSLEELYGILNVRAEVFVIGQKCLYIDPDGRDLDSVQVYASTDGRIIACLRIYQKEKGVLQIGRVAVIEPQRGKGIGLRLMQEAIRYVTEHFLEKKIYIEAQTYAIGFYEKLGFCTVSDEFLDEGIPHKGMELDICREESIVVPDVEQFPGHIACSSQSRSEIVVPVLREGNVIALIDIDSKELDTFDDIDREQLERIADLIGKQWQ